MTVLSIVLSVLLAVVLVVVIIATPIAIVVALLMGGATLFPVENGESTARDRSGGGDEKAPVSLPESGKGEGEGSKKEN